MKVAEIRNELVKSYGYKSDEVNATKKAELVGLLEEERGLQGIEELNFEEGTDDFISETEEEQHEPLTQDSVSSEEKSLKMSSPEWSDYVLSQFESDEMIDGNPTVDGLRRVTELVMGPIIDTHTEIIQVPTKDNEGRATAVCSVTVLIPYTAHQKRATGSGDAWHKNTDMPYSKFPVAMAETRAEGRALRRLLQLRKVVAAEELSVAANEEAQDYSTTINDNQINFIDIMCKSVGRGLDINVESLIKAKHPQCKSIRSLTHNEASDLIQMLSHYQQNMENVPEPVRGYKEDWRLKFDVNDS